MAFGLKEFHQASCSIIFFLNPHHIFFNNHYADAVLLSSANLLFSQSLCLVFAKCISKLFAATLVVFIDIPSDPVVEIG